MGTTIKDFGIVLKENDAGENSKRLILLTKTRGKAVVFARGAKGAKSKLSVPKLSYCEFVFYDGGQFLSLAQVSPIAQFGNIVQNYDAFCVAAFILELTDKMLLSNMDSEDALNLLLLAFSRLDKSYEPSLIFGAFAFKMLQKEGFAPTTQNCALCQSPLTDIFEKMRFGSEGFLCTACAKRVQTIACSPKILAAVKYILDAPIEKIFNFKASPDILQVLQQIAILFLHHNVDSQLKSLDFF